MMNHTRRKRPQGPARRQGSRRQGTNMAQQVIPRPPPLQNFTVTHGTRVRFVTNAAFAGNITFQNLLDVFLFAATTVLGYDLFYSVKVRAVEVWSAGAVGSVNTVDVQFAGVTQGSVGDQKWHTDSSMGIEPAHVLARPSPKSLASNAQQSSNAIAFYLACNTGSVVDCELTFVQALGESVAAQNALVGATAGATYMRGLDGVAAATTKLVPVGFATI